jgi:sn-glycerol 3-phosphate transport system permease protein
MRHLSRLLSHGVLILFILFMLLPLYLAIVAASNEGAAMMQSQLPLLPGSSFFKNMKT